MSVSKLTNFKAGVSSLGAAVGLAALLATGSALAQTPAVKGDAAAGAKKNSMCIGSG